MKSIEKLEKRERRDSKFRSFFSSGHKLIHHLKDKHLPKFFLPRSWS